MKLFSVAVVLTAAIIGIDASSCKLANVAKDKTATMSSTYSTSEPASLAIDGNTDQYWNHLSCTSTKKDKDAWFKVDLGGLYRVHEVIIANRQDSCCRKRLETAEVRVGTSEHISKNTKCGNAVTSADIYKAAIDFECRDPVVGRYVSVQLDKTEYLQFCEVQVMADADELSNVAKGGKTKQISTYSGGKSDRAVDGDDDTNYGNGHCCHTNKHKNAWWRVDLKKTHNIYQVVVTNREDCCDDRLDGAAVMIGDSGTVSKNTQCGEQVDMGDHTYGSKITFDCTLSGRYVGIELKDHDNYLHVCEVEAYGVEA